MTFTYTPHGVCSRQIVIDIDENTNTINSVSFTGGCNGNLKGITRLVEGKKAEEIADLLEGTTCGFKSTSCPDQLSRAIRAALSELN